VIPATAGIQPFALGLHRDDGKKVGRGSRRAPIFST
jgi:hypothetical protein